MLFQEAYTLFQFIVLFSCVRVRFLCAGPAGCPGHSPPGPVWCGGEAGCSCTLTGGEEGPVFSAYQCLFQLKTSVGVTFPFSFFCLYFSDQHQPFSLFPISACFDVTHGQALRPWAQSAYPSLPRRACA